MESERDRAARKPMLTVEQQIDRLKGKGVGFELCSESEAARILGEESHYFRLAACRALFPKRVGGDRDGQYAGLDFGHLVDLSDIDRDLRGFLLPLMLDVENSAKILLLHRISDAPGEDGYSILSDYLSSLSHADRNRRQGEVKRLGNDAYLGPLVEKYPLTDMPAWVYLELASFGALADFYLFCADRWNDSDMRRQHYLLRCTNSLRNAAAHSSAIINGLGPGAPASVIRTPQEIAEALEEMGVNRRSRRSKLRNPRVLQMTVLAYAFSALVPHSRRLEAVDKLDDLERRALRNAHWYSGNSAIAPSYGFLSRVFDGFFRQ